MNFLLGSDAIADAKTVKEMKFRCPNNRYSVASLLTNLLTQTTIKGATEETVALLSWAEFCICEPNFS